VVLAGGQLPDITPTWSSVKVGPLLRQERSLRRYGTYSAHTGEIRGFEPRGWSRPGKNFARRIASVSVSALHAVGPQLSECLLAFTFEGLHPHRDRFATVCAKFSPDLKGAPKWGAGDYAAAYSSWRF
jgi:hypothetical protein